MKRLLMLFFVLLASWHFAGAQGSVQPFKVLFETDQYQLSAESQKTLDAVADAAKNGSYYEISLQGYTDYEGSAAYNVQLSASRARSVKEYLVSRGLDAGRIMDAWYGERKPAASNGTEEGKQLNRRVEIALHLYDFSNVDGLLQATGGNYEQKFQLNTDGALAIKGSGGTVVKIPADAFVMPDGSPVDNSKVEISLEEFPSLGDAILNKLSTQSNGQMLESGGMIRIVARVNGQELQLRDGKALAVEMPTSNMQSGMSVFAGLKDSQGVVNWVDTKTTFGPKGQPTKPRPALILNTEKLRKYMVAVPALPSASPSGRSIFIPKLSGLPAKPTPPREPLMPDGDKLVYGLRKLVASKAYKDKLAEEKYEKAMDVYNKRLAGYEKALANYNKLVEKHKAEVAAFDDRKKAFYAQLDSAGQSCRALLNDMKAHYDALGWNEAVSFLAGACDAGKFYNDAPLQWLISRTSTIYTPQLVSQLGALERQAYFYETVKALPLEEISKKYNYGGKLSFGNFFRTTHTDVNPDIFTWNQGVLPSNAYLTQMQGDSTFTALFSSAVDDLVQREADAGYLSNTGLSRVYEANLGQMGYINCDRFSTTPRSQMAKLKIADPGNVQVMVCVNRLRSILYPNTDGNGNLVANVPKGEKVTLVAVGIQDGKPSFEKMEFTAGEDMPPVQMTPQPILVKDLAAQLAAL